MCCAWNPLYRQCSRHQGSSSSLSSLSLSSSIIIYHHLSSSIIIYRHLSSYIIISITAISTRIDL
jgi:hypothetical protein